MHHVEHVCPLIHWLLIDQQLPRITFQSIVDHNVQCTYVYYTTYNDYYYYGTHCTKHIFHVHYTTYVFDQLPTVYTLHCTVYSIHCKVYSVQCTLYTVHCTLYIVQYICIWPPHSVIDRRNVTHAKLRVIPMHISVY